MPVPSSPFPTYIELRCLLEDELGCEFKEENEIVINDSYSVTYFERDMGSELLSCIVIYPEDENEHVEADFLRHIIRRLRLDPTVFGLTDTFVDE